MSQLDDEYRRTKRRRAAKTRRAAKRDTAEPEIFAALEAFGMSVYPTDQPLDALVGYRGRNYLVEIKSGHQGYAKALNANQRDFASWWRGAPPKVLHSVDEAIAWAREVARGGA